MDEVLGCFPYQLLSSNLPYRNPKQLLFQPLFLLSSFLLQISEVNPADSVISVLDKCMFTNHSLIDFNQLEGFTLCQGAARASYSQREGKPKAEDDPVQPVPSLTREGTVPQHLNIVHRAGYLLVTAPSGSPRQGKMMNQAQSPRRQSSQ